MPLASSLQYVNGYGKASNYRIELESSLNTTDIYVVKYNRDGRAIWASRITSSGIDVAAYKIQTDSAGNLYVVGSAASANSLVYNSDGSLFGTIPRNLFLVKYNPSGFVQWTANVISNAGRAFAVAVDLSDNLIVTGNTAAASVSVNAFNADGTSFGFTFTSAGEDAFVVKYNSEGQVQWLTRIGGTGIERGYGVATDASNNIYVCATSSGTATAFAAGLELGFSVANSGGTDAIIAGYSPLGAALWITRVASTGSETANGIVVESSGNIVVVGQGGNNATPTAFSAPGSSTPSRVLANAGSPDVFLARYNSGGVLQGVARIASTLNDDGVSVATDGSGGLYVAGRYGATLTAHSFPTGTGAFGATPAALGNDAFLVKYTGDAVSWLARVSASGTDIAYSVTTDSAGNVYMAGESAVGVVSVFNGSTSSTPGTLFGTLAPTGGADAFLVKYNTNGVVQFATRIASGNADSARAITSDPFGNTYVTGTYIGTRLSIFGQSLSLFSTLANIGNTDVFVVKYNTNGQPQWAARLGSTGADIGYQVAYDPNGNVFVTGSTSGTLTAYSANDAPFAGTIPNAGGSDVFVIKYNGSGEVQWTARVASTGGDIGYGIATDSSGNAYVTGAAGGNWTAYNAGGSLPFPEVTNAGQSDVFLVKYNPDGFVQWRARLSGAAIDNGFAVTTDLSNNVYVAGQTGAGGVFTASGSNLSGGPSFTAASNDGFLAKYSPAGSILSLARMSSSTVDSANAVATAPDGSAYVCGSYTGTFTARSAGGVAFAPTLATAGVTDCFLVKYTSAGEVSWLTRIAGPSAEDGYGLGTDALGNVYVLLTASGNATVFNADGTSYPITIATINVVVAIVKYNSNGFVQWVTRIDSTAADAAYSLAVDRRGNVYVAGTALGSNTAVVNVHNPDGTIALQGLGTYALVKFDTNGVPLWMQAIGNINNVLRGSGVAVDYNCDPCITGSSTSGSSTIIYATDLTPYKILNGTNGPSYCTIKYSQAGYPLWVAQVTSLAGLIPSQLAGMAVDSAGNVYAAIGTGINGVYTIYNSNGSVFQTITPRNTNSAGGDAVLIKYNSSGAVQWKARAGSTSQGASYNATTVDLSGNVYACGTHAGSQGALLTLTISNADDTPFSTIFTQLGSVDSFLVKYDSSGVGQWATKIASANTDAMHGIVTDSTGSVYVIGIGNNAVIFPVNSNDSTTRPPAVLTGGTTIDALLVKYNSAGAFQWFVRLEGSGTEFGYGVAVDPSDNVYITGSYNGTLAVTNAGGGLVVNMPNSGGTDTFVIKYNSAGVAQWPAARIASTLGDIGRAIATDSASNVYVVGSGGSGSVTAFTGSGVATQVLTNIGNGDAFVVKYNSFGEVLWAAKIGSTSADTAFAVATDSAGNVYVGGRAASQGAATQAFNSDQTFFGSAVVSAQVSASNGFVVKYNSDGFVQWISNVVGASADDVLALAADSSSFYAAAAIGATSTLVPFDGF